MSLYTSSRLADPIRTQRRRAFADFRWRYAAFTTSQAGDWSLTSTWGGSGPPGNGDTTSVTKAVTISGNTTVGSSPSTGGTAAISMGSGGTISLTSGTLTVKGDILHNNNSNTFTMSAGTSVVFLPASGQQYIWNCQLGFADNCTIVANGSSGSHCSISTDLSSSGTAMYIKSIQGGQSGIKTATWTDFSHVGTSSNWGVQCDGANFISTNQPITVTNCTFNTCNAQVSSNSTWDGNCTFQNNTFTNSVTNSSTGTAGCCMIDFQGAASSGTRNFSFNSFDKTVVTQGYQGVTFTDNYLGNAMVFNPGGGTVSWSTESQYARNLVSIPSGGLSNAMYGPTKNCYWVNNQPDNPHFMGVATSVSSLTITGCIFEAFNTPVTDAGDCTLTSNPGSAQSITIQNCIVLPVAGSTLNSGVLHTLFGTSPNVTLSAFHNTFVMGGGSGGTPGAAFSENGNCSAGQIAAWKANLIWAGSVTSGAFKMWDSGHPTTGGTSDVVSPTNCDYNGSFNCNFTPSGGNTYTHAGNGYQFNCSATPGSHDLSDQDPQFVDKTANLSAWGGTTAGGGVATNAGALAAIAANPALIGQAGTGLLAFVYARFRPKNANLKGFSFPGDTSTIDAAGNAWPGTGPGLGAMAWQSPSTTAANFEGGFNDGFNGGYGA